MLDGRQQQIFADRDCKLEQARQRRAEARREARNAKASQQPGDGTTTTEIACYTTNAQPEDKALLGSNLSAELRSKTGEAASSRLAATAVTCF